MEFCHISTLKQTINCEFSCVEKKIAWKGRQITSQNEVQPARLRACSFVNTSSLNCLILNQQLSYVGLMLF